MKMSMAPDFRIRNAIVNGLSAVAAIYGREVLKHKGPAAYRRFQSEISE